MTSPLRRPAATVLDLVGTGYFVIAFIARLPYAMVTVGVLTLVVSGRDSIALGGLTSAVAGIGAALFAPVLGGAVDRWGQRPVILSVSAVGTIVLIAMALVVPSPEPDLVVLGVGFLVGASTPQVAPMSRSRLVGVIAHGLPANAQERAVSSTMAYESAADELVFVFGPVLVGVLAAVIDPVVPVLAAAGITLVFVTAFALHGSAALSRGDGRRRPQAPARELWRTPVVVVVAGVGCIGLFFGSALTSLTAFLEAGGRGEQSGVLYGVMGVGSAASALAMMLLPAGFSLTRRWLTAAGVLLAGAAAMAYAGGAAHSVSLMALALLVAGVGIGPSLVTLFSLGAARSPRGRSATVMTTLGAAIILGQSLAAAGVGRLAESVGPGAALLMPLVAAALLALAALVNAGSKAASTPVSSPQSTPVSTPVSPTSPGGVSER